MEHYRYRAYLLKESGGIHLAVDLYCNDDAAALEKAGLLVDGHDVELWQGDRLISRLLHAPNVGLAPE